jgi:hypothetical protein
MSLTLAEMRILNSMHRIAADGAAVQSGKCK